MRLNAHLSKEHTLAIEKLMEAVNTARARAGLKPVEISRLVHDILERTFERSSINLCTVFVTNGQPVDGTKPSMSVPIETLRWWRVLADINPQDLAPRLDAYLSQAEAE